MTTTNKFAAAIAATGILMLGACASGGTGDAADRSAGSVTEGTVAEALPATDQATDQSRDQAADPGGESPIPGAAVIRTGTISLRSTDVTRTRFQVQQVLDRLDGMIGDEETTADRDGEVVSSRLVLRVPEDDFERAMVELGKLGDLVHATRSTEDVTTQVIDTKVRIRAQEKSLERIEALLAEAEKLSDVVAIEAELTRRQAELDSLEQRRAWLEDQTSFATITVHLEQGAVPEPEEEHNAFVAGLLAGWGALGGLGSAVAAFSGVLLPFAAVVLLLAVPVRFAWRRVSRAGRTARTPSGA